METYGHGIQHSRRIAVLVAAILTDVFTYVAYVALGCALRVKHRSPCVASVRDQCVHYANEDCMPCPLSCHVSLFVHVYGITRPVYCSYLAAVFVCLLAMHMHAAIAWQC